MRPRLVSLAAAFAAVAAAAAPTTAASAAPRWQARALTPSVISGDADWLLQGQLPDGAIAWYIDKRHISPYQANYAAIGLAEAAKQTGDPTYSNAAWAWFSWYAAHEDSNGYVTDYDVDAAGIETSTGDEDSTDAYAGTFLSAVRATYLADPDFGKLQELRAGIAGAVHAIETTRDVDGLTWAKPTWHVKYLMDQAETYDGLVSGAELASDLGDSDLAAAAGVDAGAMKAGIASLWDAPTGAYDWAKSGGVNTTDWSVLYPDAMEQAWIAGSPAISNARARQLARSVESFQPLWDQPDAITGGATVGYWPGAGWAWLRLGWTSEAVQAAQSMRSAALSANRDWPFTTGVAGQLIVLESGDRSLALPGRPES
jgi:hypothetical protein